MSTLGIGKGKLGSAAVFFTAISTILGAVLFLRFGWAVGNLGFLGTLGIIILAHCVTIPTALAISEIATNQRVEGGGEYFIISRSFGINIGGAIGIALFLSQAISMAFYIIAFAEAFDPVFNWLNANYQLDLHDNRIVSIPAVLLISLLVLLKGANQGITALYVVVGVLFLSLIMFFTGVTDYQESHTFELVNKISSPTGFFLVFAIVFPAFTGMTAGVGLSGDLKDPGKAIPIGTLGATLAGMVVYIFLAYKFTISVGPDDLVTDQLVMSKVVVWSPIIPIGLAAATFSSAIGSVLVAPRTLQAISADRIFPKNISRWLAKGKANTNEPFNAGLATSLIALLFVVMGNVDMVARIISMFFMVTYGSICLISFLQYFAADPSYRPSFKSKWVFSLVGSIMTIYLMFRMDSLYAILSILMMVAIYMIITKTKQDKEGLAKIFQGVIFQISRRLQVFLQTAEKDSDTWRPSMICISADTFKRNSAFSLMNWVSHRYGFGTYIHYIHGYFSKETYRQSTSELRRLIKVSEAIESNVYVDTIISPSLTSAIAQAIQLPSVSGKDINMILFEYSKDEPGNIPQILENFNLVRSADFDIVILGSSNRNFGVKSNIHIWITKSDIENGSLMILMSYVIIGHVDWKNSKISIYTLFPEDKLDEYRDDVKETIREGRLPISPRNVEIIIQKEDVSMKSMINHKSKDADLTIIGVHSDVVKQKGEDYFLGFDEIGDVLFVNAHRSKKIVND